MEATTDQTFACGFSLSPVAEHHLRAGDADFAALARRQ